MLCWRGLFGAGYWSNYLNLKFKRILVILGTYWYIFFFSRMLTPGWRALCLWSSPPPPWWGPTGGATSPTCPTPWPYARRFSGSSPSTPPSTPSMIWLSSFRIHISPSRFGNMSSALKVGKRRIISDKSSVPDPWHFGVDPDPRIHASD